MDNLKRRVWQANISLHENNLVFGTQGNVSGIDRKKECIYIKPSGVAYEKLGEEMIVTTDTAGRVIQGSLKPSVDTPHHVFLYEHVKDIGGICHTHSKFITVFSITGINIPVLTTTHADVFGMEIPVAMYADNSKNNIGKEILRVRGKTGCNAVILGKHGLFTVAETPEKSAFYALMAEYCAEVFYHAMAAEKTCGGKIEPLSASEIKKWHGRYHSKSYGQTTS